MIETNENKGVMYEFGKFVLDPNERVLFADGSPIHLTDKVFETLLLLIQSNGRLLTKNEMIESIWEDSFVEESNLAKNVSRLRKILNTGDQQLIETLPRRGYRFLAEVNEVNGETSLLVHRRLRVKISQTTENSEQPKTFDQADSLSLPVTRTLSKMPLTIGLAAILLLIGGFLIYNFPISNKTAKSGGLTNLTNDRGDDQMPSWSPDGSKITFTSNRAGAADICVMNADGTGVFRITDTPDAETAPVWSPDGTKIFFESDRDGNEEIYMMNADGSNQIRLTFNPTRDAGPVSFSPDGKRIAFARNLSNDGRGIYDFDIYTMNVDGSDVRQLTTDPEFDAEPMWSPDGRILFISARDNNFEIYAIDLDGGAEVNLTKSSANENAVAFTTDAKQFFYIANSPEKIEFYQLYSMNADGTNRRQITSFVDKINKVVYSPQAGKFAVTSKKDGNYEIYAMDAIVPPS